MPEQGRAARGALPPYEGSSVPNVLPSAVHGLVSAPISKGAQAMRYHPARRSGALDRPAPHLSVPSAGVSHGILGMLLPNHLTELRPVTGRPGRGRTIATTRSTECRGQARAGQSASRSPLSRRQGTR